MFKQQSNLSILNDVIFAAKHWLYGHKKVDMENSIHLKILQLHFLHRSTVLQLLLANTFNHFYATTIFSVYTFTLIYHGYCSQ